MKIRLLPALLLFALLAAALPMTTPAHAAPTVTTTAAAATAKTKRIDALVIPGYGHRSSMRPSLIRKATDDLGRWVATASHARLRLSVTNGLVTTPDSCKEVSRGALETLQERRFRNRHFDVVVIITDLHCPKIAGKDHTTLRRGNPDVITVYDAYADWPTLQGVVTPVARQLRKVVPGGARLTPPTNPAAPRLTVTALDGQIRLRWATPSTSKLPIRGFELEARDARGKRVDSLHVTASGRTGVVHARNGWLTTVRVRALTSAGRSSWSSVRTRARELPPTVKIVSPRPGSTVPAGRYLDIVFDAAPNRVSRVPLSGASATGPGVLVGQVRRVSGQRWSARFDLSTVSWSGKTRIGIGANDNNGRYRDLYYSVFLPHRFAAPTIVTPAGPSTEVGDAGLVVTVRPGSDRFRETLATSVEVSLDKGASQTASASNGWTVTFPTTLINSSLPIHTLDAWTDWGSPYGLSSSPTRSLIISAPVTE